MSSPVEIAFKRIAGEIISNMQSDIRASGKVDTGRLLDSFEYDIDTKRLVITSTADYAGAVDSGRGPSTKDEGRAVQSALMSWIERKNITLRSYRKGNVSRKKLLRDAAFVMARKIHRGGYAKSFGVADFSSKTLNRLQDKITEQLGDAYMEQFSKEIEIQIKKYTDNVN